MEAQYSEYIIGIARERLPAQSVVSLETARDRAAAKVRAWKAARRAQALHEVLIDCPVSSDAVTAVYRVDFSGVYGSRLPRFKKDLTLTRTLTLTLTLPLPLTLTLTLTLGRGGGRRGGGHRGRRSRGGCGALGMGDMSEI